MSYQTNVRKIEKLAEQLEVLRRDSAEMIIEQYNQGLITSAEVMSEMVRLNNIYGD